LQLILLKCIEFFTRVIEKHPIRLDQPSPQLLISQGFLLKSLQFL